MGLLDTITDAIGLTNNKGQQEAMDQASANNAANLAAQQAASKNTLDMQKVLAYLQAMQGNQGNAQQLALSLGNQQNSLDQFAQMYNQQQQNSLPMQQAQLAQLQALTPLMQMAGMQGYSMPTSINTTPMVAPNVSNQFNQLSNMYAQNNAQNINPQELLSALNDPAAFLAGKGGTATAGGAGGSVAASSPGVAPSAQSQAIIKQLMGAGLTQAQAEAAVARNLGGRFGNTATAAPQGNLVKTPASMTQTPAQIAKATAQAQALNVSPLPVMPTAAPQAQQMTNLTPYAGQAPGSQVQNTPGYQYKLAEAQRQMNNQLSAQGLMGSGAATMMAGNMGQQLASTEYENQYNRLMDMVKLGMGMGTSTAPTQAAQQVANINQTGASNTSAALQNAAQGRNSMYSGLGNAYGQNQQNNAQALSGYYGANSAMAQSQANQPTGMQSLFNTGLKLYGMGAFGGGGVGPNTPFT